jgi:hypothetical protein
MMKRLLLIAVCLVALVGIASADVENGGAPIKLGGQGETTPVFYPEPFEPGNGGMVKSLDPSLPTKYVKIEDGWDQTK